MRQYIITNYLSIGDMVVMTAAIRDLHRAHPGEFEFAIQSSLRSIFDYNPYVVSGFNKPVPVEASHYPLVHESNQKKVHFLWGYIQYFNERFQTRSILTEFKPDLHLSPAEESDTLPGIRKPYWVIVSGGKRDYTAKWWHADECQKFVDELCKWTTVVQAGSDAHHHPPMRNAVQVVGRTSVRQILQLVRHAEGVVCPVTCYMHIAAAFNRPCVVVAGGREPWWWEAYNHESRLLSMKRGQPNWQPPPNDQFVAHRFIHTIGKLDCCKDRGCWKSHVLPSDYVAQPNGKQDKHCKLPVYDRGQWLPKCMQMITADQVLQEIEHYYSEGVLSRKTSPYHKTIQLPLYSSSSLSSRAESNDLPVSCYVYVKSEATTTVEYLTQLRHRIHSTDVTVLLDGSNADVERFCSVYKITCIRESTKPGKRVLLKTIATANKDYVAIFEPPVLPQVGKWSEILKRVKHDKVLLGSICWAPVYDSFKVLLKTYGRVSKDMRPRWLAKGFKVYYPDKGFVVIPKWLATGDYWPVGQLPESDLYTFLGETSRQLDVELVDVGDLLEWI